MGEVYRAEDLELGREVAIKFARPEPGDEGFRVRFDREARLAASLRHRNIVTIFGRGETEDGQLYLVMELVEGQTLKQLIEQGSLTIPRALAIIRQAAEGLSAAHRHGIVHRDIKPANILIDEQDEVKVLDFGLAKRLVQDEVDPYADTAMQSPTIAGGFMGTPHYASPEQARGAAAEADERSDLFSLGSVLYECLTGRLPFPGSRLLEITGNIQHASPPPPSSINPEVGEALEAIVLRLLAKAPEDRYQSAAELLAALRDPALGIDTDEAIAGAIEPPPATGARPTVANALRETLLPRRPSRLLPFTGALLAIAIAVYLLGRGMSDDPAVYRPSPEAQAKYEQAREAMYGGAWMQAIRMFEEARRLDPRFRMAEARLAEVHAELNQSDQAKDLLFPLLAPPVLATLPASERDRVEAIHQAVLRNFSQAAAIYEKLLANRPRAGAADSPEPADLLFDLGRMHEKNEAIEAAIETYRECLQAFPGPADGNRAAAVHLKLGLLLGRKQEKEASAEHLAQARRLYREASNREGLAETSIQLARVHDAGGNFSEARAELEAARTEAASSYQQISILLQLSGNSLSQGRKTEAFQEAEEALRRARDEGLPALATLGQIQLGQIHHSRGENASAEAKYREAIDSALSNRNSYATAQARVNLGSLLVYLGRLEEGIQQVEPAARFYKNSGYLLQSVLSLLITARAQRKLGRFAPAQAAYNDALPLVRQLRDWSTEALVLSEIGHLLVSWERLPDALQHYRQREELSRKHNQPRGIAHARVDQASVLWQLGRHDEARAALAEVANLLKQPELAEKQLPLEISLIEARQALSLEKPQEALRLTERVLAPAGAASEEMRIRARWIRCLAYASSGTARAGLPLCREAVALADKGSNRPLQADAHFALAAAAEAGGLPDEAHQHARQAAAMFKAQERDESEWRAWLLASLLSRRQGDPRRAAEEIAAALHCQSELQKHWGPDAFKQYLGRPDISRLQASLAQSPRNN